MCLGDKLLTFYKYGYSRKGLVSKDESAAKKQNGIMLEVKFKLNINGVIDKIGNCQNVDTAVIQETLVMYPVNKFSIYRYFTIKIDPSL